jgi:hypothetical protein
MAGLLPMSIERILAVNNLPANMKSNSTWNDMHKMAIREFEQYVEAEYWGELFAGCDTFDADELVAGELAVGIYTYVKMMPFLNLNSSPTGFVKKRGIEDNAAEIMSFSELKQYKVDMEKQALRTIQKHLTNKGFERLNKLNGKRRNLRCALISGSSTDIGWDL